MTEHDEPKTPEVMCGEHGLAHGWCTIERCQPLGGYDCYCEACDDADEGDDDGRATVHTGHGRSPAEAAENYADNFGGMAELTLKEEHV